MAKMWAGRTTGDTDRIADDFNSSIHFDQRMYREDITGSMAHAAMLGARGIIAESEAEQLIAGLEGILADIDAGKLEIDMSCEDIHMFVEQVLTERLGDVGKKLHTARSRNDQVALDLRMHLRAAVDGLIEQLGGNPTPALGFAMGLERLIMTMESKGAEFAPAKKCDLYIASMGEAAQNKAIVLAKQLRDEGYFVEFDTMNRGIKPQMKYANKIGATFTIVLGDNELETSSAKLKNMATGEQTDISLGDGFIDAFSNAVVSEMFDGVMENFGN